MIDNCLLCDSKRLALAVSVPKMPIVDGYTKTPNTHTLHKCDLYHCDDCGHVQLRDTLPPQDMFSDYLFRTGDHANLVAHYRNYADWLIREFDTSYVIEIGCNDGTLLDMLPLRSRKLGIDPSNVPVKHPIVREFLTPDVARQVTAQYGHAPLIVANHVFAHTADMHGMMEAIRLMMTSRGAFVFEVAYAQDMLDKCLYDQIEHEHISYHSLKSLIPFLNRHGLELTEYSRNQCKGGSIRCVTRPIDSAHIPNYTEDGSIFRYAAFADEIQHRRERMATVPHAIGYGAAAPCTSVMYQMNLQSFLTALVDDNASRHWLYAPHSNLKVMPTEMLYEDDSPIVILAPRYAEQIMARHPNIKHRFIVP